MRAIHPRLYRCYRRGTLAYFIDDPVIVESDRLAGVVREAIHPFVNSYIKTNYERYAEFSDLIFENVSSKFEDCTDQWYQCGIELGITQYKPDDKSSADYFKSMCDEFSRGLAKRVDLFIKKQLRWSV